MRDHLIPRFFHSLVLGRVTMGFLRKLDLQVRATIRTWLHLPKDVPIGYFHAPVRQGGLGFPSLVRLIPILRYRRLNRLATSQASHLSAASGSSFCLRQMAWSEKYLPKDDAGAEIRTAKALAANLANKLHTSVDGDGLRQCSKTALSSDWVIPNAEDVRAGGRNFIEAHQVRIQALPTRARRMRGRPLLPSTCRAGCRTAETPYHTVQCCFRSHAGRLSRHDHLCKYVADILEKRGWKIEREVTLRTDLGNRRPDLLCVKDQRAVILDGQVVSSVYDLDLNNSHKVRKYGDHLDLKKRVAERYHLELHQVESAAITISWRGVWSRESTAQLLSLGLRRQELARIPPKVLIGSHMCFRIFERRTDRWVDPRFQRVNRTGVG